MTAAELIEQLRKLPPATEVRVWDFGTGDTVPVVELDTYGEDSYTTVCILAGPSL
jgi:hypothetical protein